MSSAEQRSPSGRRPRADAERNRALLLDAAKPILAAKGAKASLEEVARAAGVGIGTLYRHFPSRDHLIIATYEAEIDKLVQASEELSERLPAVEALREWMYVFIDFVATKYGMSDAISSLVGGSGELYSASTQRVRSAICKLVTATEDDGSFKVAVEPLDLLRAIASPRGESLGTEWIEGARRLADLLIAGMRH